MIAVLGGGVGGLVAACLLARAGREVVVFEHHRVLGGLSHAFRRRRWRWDVGVHAVGSLDSRPGQLLTELAPGLSWTHTGAVGDRFELPGQRFDWPSEPAALDEALGLDLRSWRRATEAAVAELEAHVARGARWWRPTGLEGPSTAEALSRLGIPPREAAILTGRWAYHGLLPERSSFFAHALVSQSYARGSHFPLGGAPAIAHHLRERLEAHGGRVLLGETVTGLGIERSRIQTISTPSGTHPVSGAVAALGAHRLVGLLPLRWARHPWARALQQLSPSVEHVGLFLGLRGDPRQAGAGPWNLWLHNHWQPPQETWDPRREARPPACYASFPSLKDPEHEGGHTASLVAFVPPGLFPDRVDPAYRELKERMSRVLLDELLQRLPDLAPLIQHVELGTPRSSLRFLRSAAAYGLAATPERYACPWLAARTPIHGLALAGGDLLLGSVLGAAAGGELAAMALEPELQPNSRKG